MIPTDQGPQRRRCPFPHRRGRGKNSWRFTLKRLHFTRHARTLGFSIGEVRTLLRLADERKRPCAEVRVVAEAHLKDVRAKIADLRRMERVLKATVARCAAGRRADCPLIEALYQNGSAVA